MYTVTSDEWSDAIKNVVNGASTITKMGQYLGNTLDISINQSSLKIARSVVIDLRDRCNVLKAALDAMITP